MDYVGRIIRPPSEAESILLQVTVGCSHNKCAFCGAYKDKRFAIKNPAIISADLDFAARHFSGVRRLFLVDGDALVMPQKRLLAILDQARAKLPRLARVATYANAKAVRHKSDEELAELRERGLSLVYMGLESGDETILVRMDKGSSVAQQVEAAKRLKGAGFKLNITVLLGLGGVDGSRDHAQATGQALTAMDPEQAAALTLMLIPGTPLHAEAEAGRFSLPDAHGMLAELRTLLKHTDLTRGLFLTDHASNYLPLRLRLPKDKQAGLTRIDAALAGDTSLRPERLRGL